MSESGLRVTLITNRPLSYRLLAPGSGDICVSARMNRSAGTTPSDLKHKSPQLL